MNRNAKLTIEQIRAMTFAGNFHADQPKFDQIDTFIVDENNPMKDRAEAVRKMVEDGMGIDITGKTDDDVVQDYLEELND